MNFLKFRQPWSVVGMALLLCTGVQAEDAKPSHPSVPTPKRRILAADDSTRRLGIVRPDGTLEWEIPVTAIHDAEMLRNGNLLLQQGWTKIQEVTRDKKVVWEYDAQKANPGKPVEVHAFQRVNNGLTMIVESGPARIIEVDSAGKIQHEIQLKVDHPNAHSDTRQVRKLPNMNYLVAHEADGRVREYNSKGDIVWQYDVPLFGKERKGGHGPEAFGNQVYSAIRLPNGNTLIGTGNGHSVLEVNREGQIVWKLEQNDIPGVTLAWVTRVEWIPNGNVRLVNCHAGPDNPQYLEVRRDKKLVWAWKDFTHFGNSTPVVAMVNPKFWGDGVKPQPFGQPVTQPEISKP